MEHIWILLYWCQILIDINIRFSRRWKIASYICYLNSYNNMWSISRFIWSHNLSLALGLNIANPKSKSVLSHLWQEQIFTLWVSVGLTIVRERKLRLILHHILLKQVKNQVNVNCLTSVSVWILEEVVGSKSYNQGCVVLVLISGKINIILRSGTENICVHMLLQSQAFIHHRVPGINVQ